MKTPEELVTAARDLAALLRSDMSIRTSSGDAYWWPDDIANREKISARGASGLEFLRVYAGRESEWYLGAKEVMDRDNRRSTPETRVRYVSDVLLEWANQVELGTAQPERLIGEGLVEIASTDLMDQVRALNLDNSVVPAAPIVLAGAALEVALRGAVEEAGLSLAGVGGLSAYGKALRTAELITKQDMKDIESVAGLRNSAAHGHHDELSRERAGLMEQQVNMLLARLRPASS